MAAFFLGLAPVATGHWLVADRVCSLAYLRWFAVTAGDGDGEGEGDCDGWQVQPQLKEGVCLLPNATRRGPAYGQVASRSDGEEYPVAVTAALCMYCRRH